jgi:hypothetical protein
LGLDDCNLSLLRARFDQVGAKASGDVQGWDWSVKDWELQYDAEIRAELAGNHPVMARMLRNRFHAMSRAVFCTSDGQLIAQAFPGLQKSGSYNTSSTNSRLRVALSYLAGASWALAMGDDCVEEPIPTAPSFYREMGHPLKQYELLTYPEFCSHRFYEERVEPLNWAKTVYRFLALPTQDFVSLERLEALKYELRGLQPEKLDEIVRWLREQQLAEGAN